MGAGNKVIRPDLPDYALFWGVFLMPFSDANGGASMACGILLCCQGIAEGHFQMRKHRWHAEFIHSFKGVLCRGLLATKSFALICLIMLCSGVFSSCHFFRCEV